MRPDSKIENPKFALHGDKRGGILPLAQLFLERAALIDEQLTVVGEADCIALERTRGGAFEIDAVLIKTAAVAGTFELLLGFEPVRRAPQMCADRFEGIDHRLTLELVFHDPYAKLGDVFRLDLAGSERVR